jgi:hypothetical protein
MKKLANDEEPDSKVSPYLMNLRRYGGRDDELEAARKQVLKIRKKERKLQEKTADRLER